MYEVKVEGMSCGHCVMEVIKSLQELDRTATADVDLPNQLIRVETGAQLDNVAIKLPTVQGTWTSSLDDCRHDRSRRGQCSKGNHNLRKFLMVVTAFDMVGPRLKQLHGQVLVASSCITCSASIQLFSLTWQCGLLNALSDQRLH